MMKFIIPKNYKFKNRLFGIIDYPTAILNTIWNIIIYFILKKIITAVTIKIFIFTSLSFPVLLLSIVGFNSESPIYTIKFIIKFLFKQKIYLFNKKRNYTK